jgi:uncharacterized protein (DUF1015 family)
MSSTGERVQAFRAILYDPRRAGPLESVVAPPYDLIGPASQAELYERSPYNVVRLELNRDPDRYESSARLLDRWLKEGILVRAERPTVYLYTQIFRHQGRPLCRDGFVVRFRLEEFSRRRVLPHEHTFAVFKEDRLRLLTATQTNISSVFGLYSGAHPELEMLRERLKRVAPAVTVTDELGIENQLRTIETAPEIAAIKKALEEPRVLIADGHHRYETALEYQRLRRAAENDPAVPRPYDYIMMTLVACNDPGLVILPTHRVIQRLNREAMESFAARAAEFFDLERSTDREQFPARLADTGRGALGVALAGQSALYLVRLKANAAAANLGDAPPEVRDLDVSILHRIVFERIFGLGAEEMRSPDNVEYTIDASSALDKVASGRADGAFLINPPSIRDVERVSDAGVPMPEKSTYFYPKLLTGLLMNPLND